MRISRRLIGVIALTSVACGCGPLFADAAEKPVAAEHNPPGDIPDTQVFVSFESPLGFTVKVPEGWARADEAKSVRFSDKYNIIEIVVAPLSGSLTAESVKANQLPELEKNARAAKVGEAKEVKLKGGQAILIAYTSNSEPNAVTNKQIRLEHARYLFYKDGSLFTLDMAAPQGADNVDDWSLIANSFQPK
jgi:hypothetical protein